MSETNETKYYVYNLAEASQCNPDLVDSSWNGDRGVYYYMSDEIITYRISTDGKLLLLPVNTVDSYGLVWDHIDLASSRREGASLTEQFNTSIDVLTNIGSTSNDNLELLQ